MAEVKYVITSEDRTKAGTDSAVRGADSLVKSFVDVKAIMDTVTKAWGFLKDGIVDCVNEYSGALDQSTKLSAILKSTGNVINSSTQELEGFAQGLQDLTGISADAITGANALLLPFTNIGRDIFPHVTMTALNMKQVFGSLEGAASQVGRALNDPTTAAGALRRANIQLSDQTEKMIAQFMAVNDVASAQKVILAELESKFGGVAISMGNTFTGSLNKLKENIGDIKELFGEQLAEFAKPAIDAINKFFVENRLQIRNAIENIPELFSIVFTAVQAIMRKAFEPATFAEAFKILGNLLLASFRASIEMIPVMLTNLFKSGGALLTIIVGNLMMAIGEGFSKWLSEQKILGIPIDVPDIQKDKKYIALKQSVDQASVALGESVAEVSGKFISTFNGYVKELGIASTSLVGLFKKEIDNAKTSIAKIMNKQGESDGGATSEKNELMEAAETDVAAPAIEVLKTIYEQIETTADAIDLFARQFPQTAAPEPKKEDNKFLEDLFAGFAPSTDQFNDAIISAINSVEAFSIVLSPLTSVLKYAADFARGAINSALQPLVGIIVILGQTLGAILIPIFNLLAPIIKVLAEGFLLLYNWAIVPLANTIIGIVNIIAIVITSIMNVIIEIANWFGAGLAKVPVPRVGDNMLTQISMTQLNAAGQAAIETGGEGGGGAGGQITGGSTYNITLNIYNPLIMGESNETLDGLANYIVKRMRLGEEIIA
jgi:hypothetical protein